MNFSCRDPRFHVYIHTSPKGKRYVGITTQNPPEIRWGKGGKEYSTNAHFWAAIQLYGWDNFKHEIVADDLNLREASELESKLIAQYCTMDPDYGYNHTSGGNWSTPSEEVREKLRKATADRWKNPEYRANMIAKQKAWVHPKLSAEHKHKISKKLKGRPNVMKGKHWSAEVKARLPKRIAWNRGLDKNSHPSVFQISKTLTGRKFSSGTLKRMSSSRKHFCATHNIVWVNNGSYEYLHDTSTNPDLPLGYSLGRLKYVYITRDGITRKIRPDKLDSYLSAGWQRGKSDEHLFNMRKARQKYVWMYDSLEFPSAESLAQYLRNHGYSKIVSSTITALYNKGFNTSKTYFELDGKITRRAICEGTEG